MVYDFANELTGTFHAQQSRFKSEMAAEYINTVILGKLNRARQRVLMQGQWAGAGVPPGYIVDLRKTLPDGSENTQWRHYAPFSPYVEVVREYFRLFVARAGNLGGTLQHIHRHGPFYPDPSMCAVPDGFKFHSRVQRHRNGFCPGRNGLIQLLTNPAYIGHWLVDGEIIRWNNHPAIVPVDLFMRAFNYLSEVSLDGQHNVMYAARQQNARPSLDKERAEERPLCVGLLVSPYQDGWRKVGAHWAKRDHCYNYIHGRDYPDEHYLWGRKASHVDDAIAKMLHEKLRATFDPQVWDKTLSTFAERYDAERKRMQAQLATLERVMENQIASLDTLINFEMIQGVQRRYEDAKIEHQRLKTDLSATNTKAQRMEELYKVKATCDPALADWTKFTRTKQRLVAHALIDHIEAIPLGYCQVRLTVRWRDGKSDEVTLTRLSKGGVHWLPNEVEHLLTLVDAGASQIEITESFPNPHLEPHPGEVARVTREGRFDTGCRHCSHPRDIPDVP